MAEQIITRQKDLKGKIDRVIVNLFKNGRENVTKGSVEARISLLNNYWKKFEENHELLLEKHCTEVQDHEYSKKQTYDEAEDIYVTRQGELRDLLNGFNESAVPRVNDPDNTRLNHQENRLPRLPLPTFEGTYENWPSFQDLFLSMLSKNPQLSGVDKLQYLKMSVRGSPAESFIKELATTNDNFERAWNILKSQYENKRVIVRSCLEKFFAMPRMKTESAADLSKIVKSVSSTYNSLESLGRPMTSSEDFIVHFLVNLLDESTRAKWEDDTSRSMDPPSFSSLIDFLRLRLLALEARPARSEIKHTETDQKKASGKRSTRSYHTQKEESSKQKESSNCPLCSKSHPLMFCEKYKAKTPQERKQTVESRDICSNCLGAHKLSACYSKKRCFTCQEKHHTTLHDAYRALDQPAVTTKTAHLTYDCRDNDQDIILATTQALVEDRFSRQHPVRVLIDQGSQVSMVTERLVQRLKLPRTCTPTDLYGIGGQLAPSTRGWTQLSLWSTKAKDKLLVNALILPKLSCYKIKAPNMSNWSYLQGLELAEPDLSNSTPIDVLLGADVYPALIQEGLRKGDVNQPVAQNTIFGWVLSGSVSDARSKRVVRSYQTSIGDPLLTLVRRFWEQEELVSQETALTSDEQDCEQHYQETHRRNHEGRYIVRLPFSKTKADFRHSRTAAYGALMRLEKRFQKDQALESLYKDFLGAYEDLGHMTLMPKALDEKNCFYLPHRGVYRLSSSTTKLRVVFNGSYSSALMPSLNELLHSGPNLLPNLYDVLLRWRKHQFVLAADIEKMYRQILLHPDDRDYQRILWRTNRDQPPDEYQLNTVTYGLSCAPFLAMRTLRQLAQDEGQKHPLGASALRHDTYMDDILTGADTLNDLKEIRKQLINLCRAGGFPLQKWASNAQESENGENDLGTYPLEFKTLTNGEGLHPTLGLWWNQRLDLFMYSVEEPPSDSPITKRVILSQAAKLFDPLGWLSPVVIKAKITIQTSWLLNVGWDDPLPDFETSNWRRFQGQLTELKKVRIPRKLIPDPKHQHHELHGFADASERAFAAVIYLRSKNEDTGGVSVALVTAKSKVAPLKQVSLPRLELCGATLLSRLVNHVRSELALRETSVHLWTDSTIVLGWIKGHPSRWKTYVANRVAEIQRLTLDVHWHHVRSEENPADFASRGMWPTDVIGCELWWKGPDFLREPNTTSWNETLDESSDDLPEARGTAHVGTVSSSEENPVLLRFSSFTRLLRTTVWCRRWMKSHRKDPNANGELTADEVKAAEILWIRLEQEKHFENERKTLQDRKPLPRGSKLLKLTPFIDGEGLIRVGGRLKHSMLSYDEKHPVILPPRSHLTRLIVDSVHRQILHGGVQATLASLRQRFWIPAGRSLVKSRIHQCVTCVKWRASQAEQIMSDLPACRVNCYRPFLHVGIDYAGPVMLRTSPGRGHKAAKGFLAIFVCMSTRAVHLEAVSNYSTEAFLAAFRRFISRRGLCSDVYSDQGTNFQGADAELRRLFAARSRELSEVRNELANLRIKWHFNPPAAPHHGGIWEAAVKSTKFHLRRVIGEQKLTFEEMSTLLTQVEACLNSRPLAASSDDPGDLAALTPGHALIGAPLTAFPEPSLLDLRENRLSRWQLIVQMRDKFWQRWNQEYLQSLVSRQKWLHANNDVQVGSLCLISHENTPPTRWPLARVVAVHPGTDGRVRVCTLKTSQTELVRPISRLVLLPTSDGKASNET